jgi:hypothetical protein
MSADSQRWSSSDELSTARLGSASLLRERTGPERETRTPVWLLTGDARTVATLVGLSDSQRVGGDADAELVAR